MIKKNLKNKIRSESLFCRFFYKKLKRKICYTKKRIFLLKRGSFEVAKKRKRKTTKKNQKSLKNIFSYEIIGLLFILIAIFSSGANFFSDGFIPSILEYSLRFFLGMRSEEHTSELQSRGHLVCRLLLEKKNNTK